MTDHAALVSDDPATVTSVDTHCPYCALQCGMTLTRDAGEKDSCHWTITARDFPTNKGGMCRKGWASAAVPSASGRLTTPMIRERKGMNLWPETWDEALDKIAAGCRKIQAEHGRNAIGVFGGGGGLTDEKAYLLGKFARIAPGTANVDDNGRFCMASAAAAGQRAPGINRGLFVMASNLLMSAPDADSVSGGVGGPDLLVVADMVLSETAQRADVVLPITQWAKEDGTMTNLKGRAKVHCLTTAALDPVAKIPEFNACAVRIEKIPARPSRQAPVNEAA